MRSNTAVTGIGDTIPGRLLGRDRRTNCRRHVSKFQAWHAACSATEATYFLRHASRMSSSTNQTHLQAFGANLDIKDLEYKNLDDSTTETTTTQASTVFEEGEEVGGVYLATLAKRRPDLRQELSEFRTQLASETTILLKVWKLRDLSLQATQATIDAQDPLRTLKDLSQDFPRHAGGAYLRDGSETTCGRRQPRRTPTPCTPT